MLCSRFFIVSNLLLIPIVFLVSGCSTLSANPEVTSLNRKSFQLRTLWIKDTLQKENLGFRKVNRMTPLLLRNLIIQGNGIDGIVAVDLNTGKEIWQTRISNGVETGGFLGRAGVSDLQDTLYASALDGNLYSINTKDGHINWTFSIKSEGLAT